MPLCSTFRTCSSHDLLEFRRLRLLPGRQLRDAVLRLVVIGREPRILLKVRRVARDHGRHERRRPQRVAQHLLVLGLQHPVQERLHRRGVRRLRVDRQRRDDRALRPLRERRRHGLQVQRRLLLHEDRGDAAIVDLHRQLALPEHAAVRRGVGALRHGAGVIHRLVGLDAVHDLGAVQRRLAAGVGPAPAEPEHIVAHVLPEPRPLRHRGAEPVAEIAVRRRGLRRRHHLVERLGRLAPRDQRRVVQQRIAGVLEDDPIPLAVLLQELVGRRHLVRLLVHHRVHGHEQVGGDRGVVVLQVEPDQVGAGPAAQLREDRARERRERESRPAAPRPRPATR